MKLTTYFDKSLNIESLNTEVEYIFSFKAFSRNGNLDFEDENLFFQALKRNIKCVLEIDILVTENDFLILTQKIKKLDIKLLKYVRIQDPGLLNFFLENYPNSQIQLVLENGNHNLLGIKGWCDLVGTRLDKVVLSVELPGVKLAHIIKELNYPVEFLGLGPILVFYTPRPLLSSALDEESLNDEELIALGRSEESPHKGFPLTQNEHGTFMYHIKDFCLLAESRELELMGLSYFRFDPRISKRFDLIDKINDHLKNHDRAELVKNSYDRDVMKGYYRVNKTDILFPKLKNNRIKRRDLSFCGSVLEVIKEHYIAVEVGAEAIKLGDDLKLITPEGKEIILSVKSLRNTSLKDRAEILKGEIALINYKRGVWPKSSVYYL